MNTLLDRVHASRATRKDMSAQQCMQLLMCAEMLANEKLVKAKENGVDIGRGCFYISHKAGDAGPTFIVEGVIDEIRMRGVIGSAKNDKDAFAAWHEGLGTKITNIKLHQLDEGVEPNGYNTISMAEVEVFLANLEKEKEKKEPKKAKRKKQKATASVLGGKDVPALPDV